jgi:hypothetical protein
MENPKEGMSRSRNVVMYAFRQAAAALVRPQHCDHRMDFKLKMNLCQISRAIDHLYFSLKIRINPSNFQYTHLAAKCQLKGLCGSRAV